MALKLDGPLGGSSDMDQAEDISAPYARAFSMPEVRIENADLLAMDYDLTLSVDGDGVVWADTVDPRTGAFRGTRLGTVRSKRARAWLAWRDG